MLIENAIHSQQVYDPTDDSIMAEQELCMERLYDYNHTRPSEHVKRARLLKEMLAECGAGSDYNQRKTGSSVGELPALLIACGFLQGASGSRVPIKQYLQKFPKWGRFGVTSVTPFLLRPVHPKGCTPAHRT